MAGRVEAEAGREVACIFGERDCRGRCEMQPEDVTASRPSNTLQSHVTRSLSRPRVAGASLLTIDFDSEHTSILDDKHIQNVTGTGCNSLSASRQSAPSLSALFNHTNTGRLSQDRLPKL